MVHESKLVVFQEKQIRRLWHEEAWWFAIVDVVEVLTETKRARKYWSDLKKKLVQEGFVQLSDNFGQLKMPSSDGKMYLTDCANTQGMFRIIQSIPSPKAEPFKQWFAQVAYERVEEVENPELAAERARELYRQKGYSEEWIAHRMKSIDIRNKLTEEWKGRGVEEHPEYAILTAEISRATFGMTPSEYSKHKGLNRQNLRDHMTDLELIFTMLGEEATRINAVRADAQGFSENREAAVEGGTAAGESRQAFEERMNVSVVTSDNFLQQIAAAKRQNVLKGGADDLPLEVE